MDTMQQDLRLLNGRVEEIDYLVKRKVTDYEAEGQKRQENLDELSLTVAKMDQRIARIEQYLNMEAKNPNAAPAGTAQPAGEKETSSEQQLYSAARQEYDNGELDRPDSSFRNSLRITQNPAPWTMPSFGSARATTAKNGMKELCLNTRRSSKSIPMATRCLRPC